MNTEVTDSNGWVYPRQTREQRMQLPGNNTEAHRYYFAQFVTEELKDLIRRHPDTERLLRPSLAKDENLNGVASDSNKWWEDFEIALGVRAYNGRYNGQASDVRPGLTRLPWPHKHTGKGRSILISDCDLTCVTKEAVRQVLEETKQPEK